MFLPTWQYLAETHTDLFVNVVFVLRRHGLDMSGGRLPKRLFSCYNSTPVKTSQQQDLPTSNRLDNEGLSDDEERFSLLSPIYDDSFDSDEDLEPSASQNSSPVLSYKSNVSPVRCFSCLLFWYISQRTLLKTEHRTAVYRTAGDFVTDVSCREHLQIKFWVEVMSLLRVHPVSVHGNCGWSGKPKKSVLICKRKQERQADVDLVYCSWSLF